MDTINSHDSQYPDKWDKPIIIYGNENKNTKDCIYKGHKADVITNNIKNDKNRYIPPLHIITRDSGYGSNSNYGYLDTTEPDSNPNILDRNYRYLDTTDPNVLDRNYRYLDTTDPNVLDSYYYPSQRTNINKNLKESGAGTGAGATCRDRKRRIIDSIRGNGRIIQSDKDYSQYINDINGKENKVVCVGCSCCGGVTDTAYDTAYDTASDTAPKPKVLKPLMPQLEPRYTSVVIPTNGYTWASTPMPNTDNYYVDLIKRPYSPILFSQNGKQLGYRYEQIKTGELDDSNKGQFDNGKKKVNNGELDDGKKKVNNGELDDNKERFTSNIYISPESKKQYNNINKYIFVITIIVIIFMVIKYHIPPFV
jgi:hypothetical protein